MATYSKRLLSGSTDGCGISIVSTVPGTAGTAQTIHTGVSGSTDLDEVWLYAVNTMGTSSIKLTVCWGTCGTSSAGTSNEIETFISGESGIVLVVPGLLINNSRPIQAYASTAGMLSVFGYVNRITG